MAVVVETTLGDITIDLYTTERPRACMNFLKLCKMKYYNFNLFHTIQHSFLAQTGDPTGSRTGGESIWGVLEGSLKRYFEAEEQPKMKHTNVGTVSFVCNSEGMIGSQFFITLSSDLISLDNKHCVFGEVAEGLDILRKLNEAICDEDDRPFQDIRITHTIILEDPFRDPPGFIEPDRSPEPNAERLQGGRIGADEQIDETIGKSAEELAELAAEREAKARATILEMIGDIPDAEMAPPENVLFVCKLNPVTTDDDLQIIFSRFGKIKNCEVIRDKQSGDSLQYAFIEFEEKKSCEDAYFKMDNVLIDDRRIHVDFSQSVAKVKWLGKGRGVQHYDDKGQKQNTRNSNIGNGDYKGKERRNDNDEINKKDGYRRNKEDNYNYKRENDNRRQIYYYNKKRNFDKQDNDYNRKQKDSDDRYHREEKYVSKYDNNDRYRRRDDERAYRQIDERKRDSYRKPDDKQYERDRILKEDRYSHKRDEQRRNNYNIDKYKSNRKRTNSESDEETNRKNEKYKYKNQKDLINENIYEKAIKENKKQRTVCKEKEHKTKNKSDSESSSDESSKKYKKKKKSDKKKKVSSSSDSSEEDSKKKHKKKRKKKVSESSSSSASDTPKKKNKR